MTYVPDNLSDLSVIEQKELLVGILSQTTERVFPLSLAQQRLWFLDRMRPGNPAYNVPFGLRLQGDLNTEALESSVRELIQRHEILRTKFTIETGQPIQMVLADSTIDIPFIDLMELPISDRQSKAHRIAMEQVRLSFNLATGPLLRLKLIRLATQEHLLLCVMHHIVCDGWSLEIFIRELAALYAQYSGVSHASLTDLPIQYGDYAQWQREWIATDLFTEQVQYWKQKLADAPAFLNLPTDRVRPLDQSYDGTSQVILVPKDLMDSLAEFGRTQRATVFMVMLTVFKALLHSYSGSEDILVGVPIAGRNRIELEELIGCFVNMLVLRTDLSRDPRFSDLLLQVREVALDAFANADLPFERLVEDLNPERTLSYSPVIQVMFSAVKAKRLPRFGNVSASTYLFNSQTSAFDLSLEFIEDADDHWWLQVTYATALFDYAHMAKMLDDYLTLLRAVAAQPELRISKLTSLLKNAEGDITTLYGHVSSDRAEDHAAASQPQIVAHSKGDAEPHDALEQTLIRIWERVLGTSDISVHDNFFDLGGHSLLAAQLVYEVEKAVGRKIPLSSLFRSSTIEAFADEIRDRTKQRGPDPFVMELNAGTLEVPLFAIVQPDWSALGYALMARHIGSDRPFYKVQANAPTNFAIPLSLGALRALAREYVAAMRAAHPKGPYFLVGMCYGVHIAEQMVLELESQGDEIGFFGIIDTFVMEHSHIRWLEQLDSFLCHWQNVARLPLSAQATHYIQAIKKSLRQMLSRKAEPPNPWAKVLWPGKEFQPRQFNAPILLFRKPKQPYYKVRDREMGWGARSLSGVKICIVNDSAHEEMLHESAIKVIAAELKSALYSAESGDFHHARHVGDPE